VLAYLKSITLCNSVVAAYGFSSVVQISAQFLKHIRDIAAVQRLKKPYNIISRTELWEEGDYDPPHQKRCKKRLGNSTGLKNVTTCS
jgi:hypothetical protein